MKAVRLTRLVWSVIDRAITAGVDILTVNGNTGEFYGLSTSEAVTMVQSVCKLVTGAPPLLQALGVLCLMRLC